MMFTNDMVEYFGEQLSGFAFNANGWVQSYGSRCVKPPVIYGDGHDRLRSTMAQEMTKRPMKGMLTGPVTILNWSFVRNDQPSVKMQQQQSQPPQPQPPPPTLNSGPSFSPNAISTEQIQKCLDDNKNLILAILEHQNLGKFQECAQYQAVLQKNLMYLAAIADAQPPTQTPAPQTSNPQMPPNSIAQQANNYMQQQQQQHQAAAAQQGGGGVIPKLPFQLNALRTQDQQQQLLQFQQQQQQQLQAQMGMRAAAGGGAPNGMLGMHQVMQSALAGNPMGMKQDGSDAASGGDAHGQGKSRS